MKWIGCVALLIAIRVPSMLADIAPPTGTKLVAVTGIVEATEVFEDYRFFLADDRTYYGNPRSGVKDRGEGQQWRSDRVVTETSLRPGDPVRGSGGRREMTVFYAIPRAAIVPARSIEALTADVDLNKVPGALHEVIGTSGTLPESDPRGELVRRYRLQRAASGSGLELVRLDADAVDPRGRDEESMVRWAVAGVVAAVAVCGLGLWLLSRRRGA